MNLRIFAINKATMFHYNMCVHLIVIYFLGIIKTEIWPQNYIIQALVQSIECAWTNKQGYD